MDTSSPQASEENSTDHSVGQPDAAAEERTLQSNLLTNSTEFIKQYETREPELQQIINQLSTYTEVFLLNYEKAARISRVWNITFITLNILFSCISFVSGFLIGFSLGCNAPVNFQFMYAMLGLCVVLYLAALAGEVKVVRGYEIKKTEKKILLDGVENSLRRFSTAAGSVISPLKNICEHVERILQLHTDEDLRKCVEDLLWLTQLFNPEDLQRLSGREERGLDRNANLRRLGQCLQTYIDHLSLSEDVKTCRDFAKLREPPTTLWESELESEPGRLFWKMKRVKNQLQDRLNKLRESRVIVRRFGEICNQERRTL